MVTKQKAAIVAGISALVIGAAHYGAHVLVPYITSDHNIQVIYVGGVVVVSVFLIGYFGMTLKVVK